MALAPFVATAGEKTFDAKVCPLAPSVNLASATAGGAGAGAAAGVSAVSTATGITAVTHSSGALIVTGSSGYVGGTLGTAAATGPAIVLVGGVIAVGAAGLELYCLGENHPEAIAKAKAAAASFSDRAAASTAASYAPAKEAMAPKAAAAKLAFKDMVGDVKAYFYGDAKPAAPAASSIKR